MDYRSLWLNPFGPGEAGGQGFGRKQPPRGREGRPTQRSTPMPRLKKGSTPVRVKMANYVWMNYPAGD
jgi:hypothetical protein